MRKLCNGAVCALIIILCISLCACGGFEPSSSSFRAMDTVMSLRVYGGASDTCEKLQERIEQLDGLLDASDENSELYRLNTEKTALLSDDTAALLNDSLALCGRLDGSFDITVYPAVKAWGFISGEYRVPSDDELSTLAENIDHSSVVLDESSASLPENVEIDLGAVAKGYAADVCGTILSENGAQAAVLNLGGTIKLYGEKPDGSRFTVGIADPDNPAGYFGYLSCGEGVVATSGGYERFFELDGARYIHILDPETARPVDNGVQSVTIFCESGTRADAMSTALFVMGLEDAVDFYEENGGFEFIILTDDKDLYITEGIYDDFTLGEGYDFTLHKVV